MSKAKRMNKPVKLSLLVKQEYPVLKLLGKNLYVKREGETAEEMERLVSEIKRIVDDEYLGMGSERPDDD